jgi:hypothetical protein
MHVSHCLLSVPLLFSVSLMLFTLQRTTLVALCSSSSQNDLVVPQPLLMLPEVAVRQVLFPVVCRLSHMFHSQLEEIMAIQIIVVVLTMATIHQAKLMVSHTLLMVKSRNNNQQYQCTMAGRPQLEDMEVSDPSNLNNLTSVVLNRMLVLQPSQCRAWFLASH